MKKSSLKKIATLVLAFVLSISIFGADSLAARAEEKTLDIVYMHDIHSHLDSFNTIIDGKAINVGGLPRIKTLINKAKEKNPDTLVLDGGDFSMGTIYQTIFEDYASELRMLGYLGVDVTTIGNHEFDYRSEGLCNMLRNSLKSGDKLPQMVVSNIDESVSNEGADMIMKAFDEYGVKDYVMVKKGNVNIAVMGIFGIDALDCAPTCELGFKDPVEAAKDTVKYIKENEDADMIVCVSHSGLNENPKKSEDEILAKKVPEIDVIVSAHTHTYMEEPIVHGETYVVSSGEYGKYLGQMSLAQKENGRWELKNWEATLVDESIESDKETVEKLSQYKEIVNNEYLKPYGYTVDQVIASSGWDFEELDILSEKHIETRLGNILADSYISVLKQIEGEGAEKVDVAVVPSGIIRETLVKGDLTVSDVYNILPLGIGKDGIIGYPIISLYLTGEELRTVSEVDASISDLMTTARLYTGGMGIEYNPNRLILNKAVDVFMIGENGEKVELENDKTYRVVTDLYSAQMLSHVTDLSKGLLKIQPKFKDGTIISSQEEFEKCIVYNDNKELKLWQAVTMYLSSFDKNEDGVSEIPEYYSTTQNRKIVNDSKDLKSLLEKPNKYAIMIVAVVLVLIAIIVLIVVLIVKKVKKHKRKKQATISKE